MKISNIMGCTGSVIFILLVSAWIPFIGPFFALLTPLPFLFYTSKLGLSQGLKVALVTLFIVGIITGLAGYPHQIILFCFEFGIVGLIISEIFRRKFSFGLTIFWGTVLMLFVGGVFLFFISLHKGMSPLELILDYFLSNLNKSITLYESKGLNDTLVMQLRQFAKLLTDLLVRVYPSLLIVMSGFVIWINVVVSKPLFRLKGIRYPDLGQTDRWRAPEFMVWGVIGAGFSLFLPITGVKFVAENVLIVLSVIYVFHGLSIIMFFFKRYNVPTWARFGVYALIIVQQMFLIVLAFAGLFDQWIDFRKIHRKGSN